MSVWRAGRKKKGMKDSTKTKRNVGVPNICVAKLTREVCILRKGEHEQGATGGKNEPKVHRAENPLY